MNKPRKANRNRHQRNLRFSISSIALGPWNGMNNLEQQNCQQALTQLLLAVTKHKPSGPRDNDGQDDAPEQE